MKKAIKRIITIIIAQFITASAFSIVMLPNKLAATGLGGVATTINKLMNLNIQLLMVIMAIPILLWAIMKYEKSQVFYAGFSYVMFTVYLGVVVDFIPLFYTDAFVAALVAGVLMGLGTGMVMRLGIPNGPEAIVSVFLQEKKDITPGNFFLVLNTIIILSSIVYGDLTLIIYSLLSNFICSTITDKVILGTNQFYDVNIITDNIFDITDYIRKKLGKSVTFIQCMDTENVKKKMMIKTVVSKHELSSLKNYIKELNDGSFVFVSQSTGLIGTNLEAKRLS